MLCESNASSMVSRELVAELRRCCSATLVEDADLASLSRWRVGGRASVLARPESAAQVAVLIACLHRYQANYLVIGATSNLLFADAGLHVVGIQIGNNLARITLNSVTGEVEAEAGAWMPGLARRLMLAGLSGLEHTSGIPGTLGGLICMNGGSQRKGIGSHVVAVTSVTPTGELITRSAAECAFDYRESVFQRNREVIVSVKLQLTPGADPGVMRREMLNILRGRRLKFPQKQPNCGSVFKSNPAMYAEVGPPGAVIERLGFKGAKVGGAQVSAQHANFIINTGGAKALDMLTLIAQIQHAVEQHTGYNMVPEAGYVTPEGEVIDPVEAFARLHSVNQDLNTGPVIEVMPRADV